MQLPGRGRCGGIIEYMSDVKDVHLSAIAGVNGIDNNSSSVRADAGMQITAPFAFVLSRSVKAGKRYERLCRNMIEIEVFDRRERVGVCN